MLAIFKREMKSYFISPIGYIFISVFLMMAGGLFAVFVIQSAENANLPMYFLLLIFIFIILIPLLTMRLLSEERKMKTEQLLLTAPVSLTGIVFGKFFAAFVMFAGTLLLSCVNFIILYVYGNPNTAIILGNVIGILLIGGAFISVGLFISAMTENQLTAAIISIGTILALLLSGVFVSFIDNTFIRYILSFLSIFSRFSNFTYGIFDINSLIYYISITVIFLFLTIRVYEMRRWQ